MSELITKTFKLPKPLADALARQAKERGVSESELIRQGLESTLNDDQGIDMAKALKGYIGAIKSGVGDLSTNRKHMAGYGRSRNR